MARREGDKVKSDKGGGGLGKKKFCITSGEQGSKIISFVSRLKPNIFCFDDRPLFLFI